MLWIIGVTFLIKRKANLREVGSAFSTRSRSFKCNDLNRNLEAGAKARSGLKFLM
jgi:hypothetical protein